MSHPLPQCFLIFLSQNIFVTFYVTSVCHIFRQTFPSYLCDICVSQCFVSQLSFTFLSQILNSYGR